MLIHGVSQGYPPTQIYGINTFQTSALGMELIPFYISNLEVMNVEIET